VAKDASCRRPLSPNGPSALASIATVAILVGCAETSLNEAPIINRSSRPTVSTAPARSASADAGSAAVQEATAGWYTVQKGDTLYHISTLFHCGVQDLARWNGIPETGPLTVGQRLRVRAPPVAGINTEPRASVGTGASAEPAEPVPAEVHAVPVPLTGTVETHTLEAMPLGANQPPAGAAGSTTASNIPPAPPASASRTVSPAQVLSTAKADSGEPAPGAVATNAAPAPERPAASVPWIWPVQGRVIGTFDAVKTKGIEIAAGEGAKILAVADGEVSYTGAPRDYGNLVIVRHPDGLLSVYAHTKTILVTQGQTVKRGQAIATAGSTDSGAQQSMHFEVRRKGVPIDPLELLPAR